MAAVLVISVSEHWPSAYNWFVFLLLTAATTVHMVATRTTEERRRVGHIGDATPTSVDHTGLWTFAAALLLPLSLAVLALLIKRLYRYSQAFRSPVQFLYTTATLVIAVCGAHGIAVALMGTGFETRGELTGNAVVALMAAAVWYWLAQTALIGGVRTLDAAHFTWRGFFGPLAENGAFLIVLAAGGLAALAVGEWSWLAVVLITPAAVAATVLERRVAHAVTDHLTRLPNRHGWTQLAATSVTRATPDQPVALVIADIDHFKQWNTELGHPGADQVLIAVADAFRAITRTDDLLCRYGGEEIVMLLPDTHEQEALRLAERLRATVEALRITIAQPAGGRTVPVTGCTISLGLATAPADAGTLDDLLPAADAALQFAKDNGRNQARRHNPAAAAPTAPPSTQPEGTHPAASPARGRGTAVPHDAEDPPQPADHATPPDRPRGLTGDTTKPSAARVYDALLGGAFNHTVDRDFAAQLVTDMPELPTIMLHNRDFLTRSVRFLVTDAGVRQFLDLGSGMPTVGNVHEIVHRTDPEARVVYVDSAPDCAANAADMLADTRNATAICGDLTDPDHVLDTAADLLDFTQPVAVLCFSVLQMVPGQLGPIIARYRDATAPGSWLAISHFTVAGMGQSSTPIKNVVGRYDVATHQYHHRSDDEIRAFFDGYTLVEPGFVRMPNWRPDSEQALSNDEPCPYLAGVGRKP